MKTANFLHRVIAAALMIAALATGQQALAETVTYTLSGSTETNGNVNFVATASGSATGTASDQWPYATTQSRSISLPGSITLSFGSDKTSSLAIGREALLIQANASTGGYITLAHASKYIYHVTLKDPDGHVLHEAWNLTKSCTYRFQTLAVHTIVVEYATAIPITDAEISGIDAQYPVSNAAVQPTPTVTWHGTTLTRNTHYTVSYQNNTSAGTATVRATGRGAFSTSTSVTKNFTLVWATYTVHFDANGGEGTMSDQAFTYNTAQNLSANTFTRTGYNFAGWNTAADGTGTAYTDGQSVQNLTVEDGATVTLYAQWTPITYTVRFNANGGEGTTMSDISFTYDEAQQLTANVFTLTGYTFSGWNTEADGTGTAYTDGQSVQNLTAEDGATVTLYAQWTPITYHITYELNGGAASLNNPTTYTVESGDITISTASRAGYTFLGWTGTDLTEPTQTVTIPAGSTGDRTFTANWSIINYTITYNLNGGEWPEGQIHPDTYTIETPTFTIGTPIKTGYIFRGWTGYNTTIRQGSIDNRYYAASWTAIGYFVHFDANGGEGTMSDQTFLYDYTINLLTNAFTRIGYAFNGWNTKADGTGESFADGQSVSNLTTTSDATITLYAQWTFIGVPYIDADGTEKLCTNFTVITSSDRGVTYGNSNDEENWYVVSGEVTISGQLLLYGQASHLILCDGATLTVTSSSKVIASYGSLTLYSQSQQSGTLNASSNNDYSDNSAIYTKGDLTINGGIVNATALYRYAIIAYNSNVTINGGTVTATVEDTSYGRGIYSSKYGGHVTINGGNVSVNSGWIGIVSSGNIIINGGNVIANGNNYGLCASSGDVTINGGRVTATSGTDNYCYGIYAGRNITLGWTNASDSITASSYRIGGSDYGYFLKVADGQALTDGTDTYTGTLTDTQRNAIAGKALVPYTGISVGDVNGDGEVNIADVPALVALILSDSPYDPVADINGDNRLSIADVTALVNQLREN